MLDVAVSARRGAAGVGPGGALAARGKVWVDVTLRQARWVVTDMVRIRVGGDAPIDPAIRRVTPGVREQRFEVPIMLGKRDAWIGVDALGATPLPAEVTGSAYAEDGHPGAVPAAVINPILVDVDGDGVWTRGDGRVRIEDGGAIGGRASLTRR